ncbi:MAG TPA: hypothetical protein VIS06_21300 [Mycobacteriales bacterium]
MADRPRHAGGIWVSSDVAADGTYIVTVDYDDNHSRPLDRDTAVRYATTVLDACQYAEHDAAILAQLTKKLRIPVQAAAEFIAELRQDRPPLDCAALTPLGLEPGISARTRRPFLVLYLDGQPWAQWDVADGRQHAHAVLDAVPAVDLDAAYYRRLTGAMGVDPDQARQVIHDLANFRDDPLEHDDA